MYPDGYCMLMADSNQWMSRSPYEGCARLSDEQRKRDLGAFFTTIHGTLHHLLCANKVWMGRFLNAPFVPSSAGSELFIPLRTSGKIIHCE